MLWGAMTEWHVNVGEAATHPASGRVWGLPRVTFCIIAQEMQSGAWNVNCFIIVWLIVYNDDEDQSSCDTL